MQPLVLPSQPLRRAANGVAQYRAERQPGARRGADVYVLPAGREGVPRQIAVMNRPWYRGGSKAEASDGGPGVFEVAHWDGEVTAVDAASGTVTTLNVGTLDLTVSSQVLSSSKSHGYSAHIVTQRAIEEKLSANGDIHVRTAYYAEEERHVYPHHEMPTVIATRQVERWEDTRIPLSGEMRTVQMAAEAADQNPWARAQLDSRVDQSGDLIITRPDHSEQIYHLFIPPHAAHVASVEAPRPR